MTGFHFPTVNSTTTNTTHAKPKPKQEKSKQEKPRTFLSDQDICLRVSKLPDRLLFNAFDQPLGQELSKLSFLQKVALRAWWGFHPDAWLEQQQKKETNKDSTKSKQKEEEEKDDKDKNDKKIQPKDQAVPRTTKLDFIRYLLQNNSTSQHEIAQQLRQVVVDIAKTLSGYNCVKNMCTKNSQQTTNATTSKPKSKAAS